MGIPILRGRDFSPQDATAQPSVAIIDEKLARQCFADRDPIGQRLDDLTLDTVEDTPPLTIIGVVPFVSHEAPGQRIEPKALPQCYVDLEQFPPPKTRLMVRSEDGDPLRLADELQRTVSSLDPTLPLFDTTTMEQRIAHHLTPQRLTTVLLGVFATVALTLAATGLYGMIALRATQRTHELSIRIALGAQRIDVLMLVLRRGMLMIGVGLILGLMASYGLNWVLWHYGLSGGDLQVLGTVCAVVAGVALLACWVPARRVTRLNPMAALRDQ
ncbi:MAG: ABC transporter permease [Rhodospirillales bacterium]|nr:ABC transporter permease [Acetobacter sp.]